jgi:hypothetical protein
VVAYLDRHDIPIMPGYHAESTGCAYPWWRTERADWNYDFFPEELCWYHVRSLTVGAGYTAFWEHIIDHYPRGEEMAAQFAANHDEPFPDIAAGYDTGADVSSLSYVGGYD